MEEEEEEEEEEDDDDDDDGEEPEEYEFLRSLYFLGVLECSALLSGFIVRSST